MDCYIYFKAGTALEEKVIAAEKSLQQLTGAIGNRGKLQRRPESANSLHTWMEVYANVPDDFSALLEKLVQQTGLTELQYSERRTEYFWM
jgi:cell division protein FtsX